MSTITSSPQAVKLRCEHCGYEGVAGKDTGYFWRHLGGHPGSIQIAECIERPPCWQRMGW